jgi:hypothetical protein
MLVEGATRVFLAFVACSAALKMMPITHAALFAGSPCIGLLKRFSLDFLRAE